MTAVDPATVGRRQFMGYLVKGAGLAVAVRVGIDLADPAAADGLGLIDIDDLGDIVTDGGGYPEFADGVDLTDLLLLSGDPFYYDYLIAITPENRVRFEVPRMEQGQGIDLLATMIVAEELDVRVDQIDTSLSPAEIRRSTGQITGGSHATTSLWDPLRKVTAQLRDVIVALAATELGVPPTAVSTRDAVAFETGNPSNSVEYTELSDGVEGRNDSARPVQPKDPDEYRVIGQPYGRLDAREIVTGAVTYAMDLSADDIGIDAPICVVARGPVFGSEVVAYDDSAARDLPGVIRILEVRTNVEGGTSGVAVIARSTGEAFRARDALQITWSDGSTASDDDVIAGLRALNLPTLPAVPALGTTLQAEFIFPYFAHAPMETMTAVADVRDDGTATVWTGAKTPLAAQAKIFRELNDIADDVELDPDEVSAAISVVVIPSGGSFGRRLFFDAAVEAARISKDAGMPVKLLFTRQDDTNKGRARPLSLHNVQATYQEPLGGGDPEFVAYDHRCATPQLDLRHGFGDAITALGAELAPYSYSQTIWHSTQLMQYDVGVTTLLLNEPPLPDPAYPVPTSSWRGIYSGTAGVANEVLVDELARSMDLDELEFRRRYLTDERTLGVLEELALVGDWGRTLRSTSKVWRAQGVGFHKEYKSRSGVLVEVECYRPKKDRGGTEMRVTRAVVVLDVNRVVNPLGLEAQAQGCVMDAIAYIIRTGLHLDDGAIRESSYGDFEIPRMDNSPPEFEFRTMPPNGERPGGAGELVIPAAAAAIANAFARATGVAPRRFPLTEFYPEAGTNA